MTRPRSRPANRRGSAVYLRAPGVPAPVNGYSILLVSPVNGFISRNKTPLIEFRPFAELGSTVDVQIEWRTTIPTKIGVVWTPTPTYTQTLTGLSSGDVHSTTPPTELSYSTWFYRLRAGKVATGTWGDWTATDRKVEVQPVLGSAEGYIEMNIGVSNAGTVNASAYIDMNIGLGVATEVSSETAYTDMNVGITQGWKLVASYTDMNVFPPTGDYETSIYSDLNVDNSQPDPVIWWIRPEQGREGYVFNIYGHGFGDFENQYDGVVKLGNLVCQISRWEKVSAVGNGPYQIIHGEALEPDVITPEHGWIVAIVPSGAVSSMVRVILEAE